MSTDDSPRRELGVWDSEGLPAATPEHTYEESTSNPMEKPRREVWWLDLGATDQSLKSIRRCFSDRLNRSLLSSSNSLLRHIRSPEDGNLRRILHRCPGYLRQEITLTYDLSKSAIVSHTFPGPSERCSICHQLVQYTYCEYSPSSLDLLILAAKYIPSSLDFLILAAKDYPSVSRLHHLLSAFVDDLRTQVSPEFFFANAQNVLITGGIFHCSPVSGFSANSRDCSSPESGFFFADTINLLITGGTFLCKLPGVGTQSSMTAFFTLDHMSLRTPGT